MRTEMSHTQRQFFDLLEHYPRFTGFWSREHREYNDDAVTEALGTCSSGEIVILKCLVTIWRGNAGPNSEFQIDLAELAIVNSNNRRPLLLWLAEPFWP